MGSNRSATVILIKRGREYAHAVVLDGMVRALTYPVRAWWHPEEYGLRQMMWKGSPYSVQEAARKLLEIGTTFGMYETARHLLVRLAEVPRNHDAPTANTTDSQAPRSEEQPET